ncbi:ATP-binding protein [Embleya sp. NBC_00888]|uniref:ATP-binding protein n=1 Tax=Embleya sp. NBC_00888 TaxID=2975960 RepID=UPI003866BE84|nr:ATP-binding protein [Embleya sp. NBC_00888]
MTTTTSHIFQVAATPERVPWARHETAKVLDQWAVHGEVADAVHLVVTELVTNVARHAALISPNATVRLELDAEALVVGVADAHPFRPRALPVAHPNGGRGLLLIRGLVEELGGTHWVAADTTTGGKEIVVRLPLTAPGA